MNMLIETVEAGLCGTNGLVLPLELDVRWRPEDPWTVELIFRDCRGPGRDVSWLVARDLLAEGLTGAAGVGDVRVCPVEPGVVLGLELTSPDGYAVFELDEPHLRSFLHDTYAQIPAGEELLWIPLDKHLTSLLNGEPR